MQGRRRLPWLQSQHGGSHMSGPCEAARGSPQRLWWCLWAPQQEGLRLSWAAEAWRQSAWQGTAGMQHRHKLVSGLFTDMDGQ